MSESCVNRKILFPQSEEDGSSIFLGKIRAEDLHSEDLISQLEQKCDDLIKQNLPEESKIIELDGLLDSVDIVGNAKFGKELNIGQIFWQKILGLLSLFDEAFALELGSKLDITIAKEKQKKKNFLLSFLDSLRKKLFKKELSLEEMLDLQMKALEEQLQNEMDPEAIAQIKKQLEFLMQLKAELFGLSLEQGFMKTMKWLFTISAVQTINDVIRGEYRAKDIITTNQQWQKVDRLLNSGELEHQVKSITHNDRSLEKQNTKPSNDQNNNLNLLYPQQISRGDNSFLNLLYALLQLAAAQGMKHMNMGVNKEVVATGSQKIVSEQNVNRVNNPAQAPPVQQSEVRAENNAGKHELDNSSTQPPSMLENPTLHPVTHEPVMTR